MRQVIPINLAFEDELSEAVIGKILQCSGRNYQVESWILADQENIANFLGVGRESFPAEPDAILDPKQLLVNLARTSRKRTIRMNLVPKPGSTAKVGPAYNKHLCEFVQNQWNPILAGKSSPSLMQSVNAIYGKRK